MRVTPGFGAIALPAGEHHVEVRYAPGRLKPILFAIGILFVAVAASKAAAPRIVTGERRFANAVEGLGQRLATRRALAACAIAGLLLLSTRALFRGQLIDGHDATEYPPRLSEFASALLDGHQLPPVWAPDLGNGHGQPLFEFVPPLIYAAALPLWKLGFSLADSLQLALAFLVAFGGVAMYRLARMYHAPRSAALAVTGAWLFAPYLDLDLYVSTRFAESAALALAPLALLTLERALQRPSLRRVAVGALAMALIPLAHNAMALLLFPVFAVLVVAEAAIERYPLRIVAAGASVIAGALGLSAFFWLPALLEKGLVKTELLRTDFLNWSIHAISPQQLFWSPWGYGYSVAGPHDGISSAPGLLLIGLAGIGTALALKPGDPKRRARTIVFAAAALVAAWLATEDSAVIWSRVATLQYLAYPWRTLCVVALTLPLLALPALQRIGRRGAIALLGLIVILNLNHTEPKGYLTFDDEYYYPQAIAEKGINTTTREEYEPRWVAIRPPYGVEKLRARGGQLSIQTARLGPSEQVFRIEAANPTAVEALTFYYPGWTATVDASKVPVSPCPITGTMCFQVPSGHHSVSLRFGTTPVRAFAKIISMLSLVALVVAAIVPALIGRRGSGAAHSGGARNVRAVPTRSEPRAAGGVHTA